jgi:guanine deaminase
MPTTTAPRPPGADRSRAGTGTVHRGHLIHITGAPVVTDARHHLVSIPDGALAVSDDGTISWAGPLRDLPEPMRGWPAHGGAGRYLLPGFVDTHLHFPQTYCTDSYGGGQLLEWLDRCVFPAEARLADPVFAGQVAADLTRRRIAAGTTAAMVFGSAFGPAQDALFEATARSGLRIVSGRGIQTTGPQSADGLITGEVEAVNLAEAEVARWHAADTGDPATARLQVALVPRFSLSVTAKTLALLGDLYEGLRGRGVYVHTHLNENNRPGTGEIDLVRAAYQVEHYLDTYDGRFLAGSRRGGASLLGRRTILAHAVHCADAELARMAETGTSIAHCPTSQQFLGSGTMPWRRTVAAGVTVALGTDIGAGDEWLIPRVLNDCFKVHLSESGTASAALHPAELLFTATLAGARALDMEARFGNFDPGKDADFVVIEPDRWEPLAQVLAHHKTARDQDDATDRMLFALLMGLREPAITSVWVQGRRAQLPR